MNTLATTDNNTSLALPEGFQDFASPEEIAELQRRAKEDSNRKPGELPHQGPKVDWYDIKKPSKNDREGTEVITWLRVLPQSKDLRKEWWLQFFGHKFEIPDPNDPNKTKWVRWHCLETKGGEHKCAGTDARISLYQRSNEIGEEKKPARESDSPVRAMAKKFMSSKGLIFNALIIAEGRDNTVGKMHRREDDTLHPRIVRVPGGLANKLMQLEAERGLLAHPLKGLNVKIIAKKTGPFEQNIEYSVIGGERQPLAADWFPIFDNLVDLSQLLRIPESEAAEWRLFRECIPSVIQFYEDLTGIITVDDHAAGESFETARPSQNVDTSHTSQMPTSPDFIDVPMHSEEGDDIPF